MKLAAVVLLMAMSLATSVAALSSEVERAEIVWAGLYQAQIIGTMDQPHTAIGRTNQLGGIKKLEATTTVPARIGVNFGLEYRLLGAPTGGEATVNVVVVPPKAGLVNPATKQPVYRETWRPSPATIGASSLIGYLLEADWEIVPGLWKFEIWHGDRKLGEQTFCLIEEEGPGRPAGSQKAQEERCHSAATA